MQKYSRPSRVRQVVVEGCVLLDRLVELNSVLDQSSDKRKVRGMARRLNRRFDRERVQGFSDLRASVR